MPFLEKPDDVNQSQWLAITHNKGNLLIVAGPGTGKTHTLTYRILHFLSYLKDQQKILAVTFTHKAALEMLERIKKRSESARENVVVTTFHQFCLNFLKQHLSYQFTVPSAEQVDCLSREIWPSLSKSDRKRNLERISLWKARDFYLPAFGELLAYDELMRQRGWLDFDDLLLETFKFLTQHKDIANLIRHKYPFIFVDEYQDINPIQHRLLKILALPSGVVTAIGDPHQAIYGFRGSDVKLFVSFPQDFSNAAVLNLSENYRSAQTIISVSSQLISGHSSINVAPLTARIYERGHLLIHETPTEKAEAEYVVHQIEKMVGGTSMFSKDSGRLDDEDEAVYGFDDIAILFRLNSQRALFEEALNRSGIPYQITEEREYEDPQELLSNAFKHTSSNGKVSLMTLHASKGLEFSVVFIVGCEENLLPLNRPGLTTDAAEERRLFYVGVTRAKERLFLVRAKQRRLFGKIYETKPSGFLSDIKEELKEYEKTEAKPRRRGKKDEQMKLFG